MVLVILGLALAGAGVATWAIYRDGERTDPPQGGGAEKDKDAAVQLAPQGVSTESAAEANDTVPQRADEEDDRPARSPAALQDEVVQRFTADAWLTDTMFDRPYGEPETQQVNDASADVGSDAVWTSDSIVNPRDVADSPLNGANGNLTGELV